MKKKFRIHRIIGGLIVVIGIILVILFSMFSLNEIVGYFGVGFTIIGVIWLSIVSSISKKYCDKCGEILTGCAYSYREKNRKLDPNSLKVNVEIRCTCPYCGAQKKFVKTFTVSENTDNLQYQVDNYCEQTFGH